MKPASPLPLPLRVLWNAFFWTYERTTWQYDLMVIAILAFVWPTPPDSLFWAFDELLRVGLLWAMNEDPPDQIYIEMPTANRSEGSYGPYCDIVRLTLTQGSSKNLRPGSRRSCLSLGP